MPSSPIKDHRDVFVFCDRRRETIKKLLHCSGIDLWHHKGEGIVRKRLYRREQIGEGKALISQTRRPLAPDVPAAADAALLPDARFVLEKNP